MAEIFVQNLDIIRLDGSAGSFVNNQWAYVSVTLPPSLPPAERLYGHALFGGCQPSNPNEVYVMTTRPIWSLPCLVVIANLFGTLTPPSDFSDDLWYMAFKPRITGYTINGYGP